LKLVFIFTLVKFYLLTVKFTKTWQLRKKLLKKLQRKPLPRKRKLQRRKNNFSFLESKKYQSPGFIPGLSYRLVNAARRSGPTFSPDVSPSRSATTIRTPPRRYPHSPVRCSRSRVPWRSGMDTDTTRQCGPEPTYKSDRP